MGRRRPLGHGADRSARGTPQLGGDGVEERAGTGPYVDPVQDGGEGTGGEVEVDAVEGGHVTVDAAKRDHLSWGYGLPHPQGHPEAVRASRMRPSEV